MYANEDINVVYEWDHINRTQIMTASGTQTNIYQTYPLSESAASGITKKILKIGNADYRENPPFSNLEIKRLVITQYQTYNSAFDNLSVVDEDLVFDGWYTNKTTGVKLENTSTQPASDITYYARWTQ